MILMYLPYAISDQEMWSAFHEAQLCINAPFGTINAQLLNMSKALLGLMDKTNFVVTKPKIMPEVTQSE
jgi:hypothetical protein